MCWKSHMMSLFTTDALPPFCSVFPALLRQASYGTLKIGLYHTLKGVITPDPLDERLLTNVCAGVISGAVSSAIANPTDVLKVRMQAGGGFKAAIPQGASTATAFVSIYQLEGIRGLYRVCKTLLHNLLQCCLISP